MASQFPSALDDFINPASDDTLTDVPHADQHANANDAIEALEAKIGIDESDVITSIDYLLTNVLSIDPGHGHSISAIVGLQAALDDFVVDHGDLTGLADDDHLQYALLTGRIGGQTLIGGTASGNNLTLQSTSHATKGKLVFGTSAYDEVNNRLGIGTASPAKPLDVVGEVGITGNLTLANSSLLKFGTANGEINLSLFGGALAVSTNAGAWGNLSCGILAAAGSFSATGNATIANGVAGGSITIGQGGAIQGYTSASIPTLFLGKINFSHSWQMISVWGSIGSGQFDTYITCDVTSGLRLGGGKGINFATGLFPGSAVVQGRFYASGTGVVTFDNGAGSASTLRILGDVQPETDNTYYLGRNDDDSPKAWKGVILKDTTNGKYYRVEIVSGVITAFDLTD